MKDDEIGLTFFTEGEPRSPEGLPSVFGVIDQGEMLARIDEVQDDDLASSFFADSLIEVEEAATRIFDIGVRPRDVATVEEPASTPAALSPDDVFVPSIVVDDTVEQVDVEDGRLEAQVVEEPATVMEESATDEGSATEEGAEEAESAGETATRQSRLGAAREEVVAMTRTVITVPGILSKSAEARRSFILGGPAAMDDVEH